MHHSPTGEDSHFPESVPTPVRSCCQPAIPTDSAFKGGAPCDPYLRSLSLSYLPARSNHPWKWDILCLHLSCGLAHSTEAETRPLGGTLVQGHTRREDKLPYPDSIGWGGGVGGVHSERCNTVGHREVLSSQLSGSPGSPGAPHTQPEQLSTSGLIVPQAHPFIPSCAGQG